MRRAVYWYPFGTDLKDKTKQKATKSRETKEADLTPDGRRVPPPPSNFPLLSPAGAARSAQRAAAGNLE